MNLIFVTYSLMTALLAYLLGSVNFGIVISKIAYKDDIRRHGSGNAGMTNALRVYGGKTAVWVFAGDFLKGFVAVLAARLLVPAELTVLLGNVAALCVVLGHLFPVFFGFRGGKGVATAAGTVLALNPILLLVLLVPFVLILLLTRYMSLASVTVAALLPCVTIAHQLLWATAEQESTAAIVVSILIGGLVVWMHRANIVRLCKGTENKLGGKTPRS